MSVIAAIAVLVFFTATRGNPIQGHNFLPGKEAGDVSDDGSSAEGAFGVEELSSVFPVGKRGEFNSWGGKRGEFNSWGGKRGEFNSWGGKRGEFNSWGGKRAAEPFNSWGGKRGEFNSWGGKRGESFNSWGGKRAAESFNSWGGKRQSSNGRLSSDQTSRRASPLVSRTPFNSWGGKRGISMEMPQNNASKSFDKSPSSQDFSLRNQVQANESNPSQINPFYV